jgi:hypothetical protein
MAFATSTGANPSVKSVWFRPAAVGVAALLLSAAFKRAEPSSVVSNAANAFLNSRWPDQKAKVFGPRPPK